VVIAELSLYEIMERLERTEIKIVADLVVTGKAWDYGVQVRSMNKTLKDAWVICNGVRYPWSEADGKTIEKRDIYVGEEPPARFVPFKLRMEELTKDNIKDQPDGTIGVWLRAPGSEPRKDAALDPADSLEGNYAFLFIVTEALTGKDFFRLEVVHPLDFKGSINLPKLTKKAGFPQVSIRLVAEGVEEVKNYRFRLSVKGLAAFDYGETKAGALSLVMEEA
jgi:hypothetical protein